MTRNRKALTSSAAAQEPGRATGLGRRCRRWRNMPSERWTAPRDFVAGANLDDVRDRAAETASSLYRGGRELLAGNEDLKSKGAADNLSAAVRKNPLAAVGIAFSAGLLLALLTRG